MKKKNIICLLTTAVVLSSCSSVSGLRSNYKRPGLQDRNIVRIELQSDTLSTDHLLAWRKFFTDADLQSLIEEGLQNNADLSVAKLKVDETAASLSASKKALFPTVSASASGTVEHDKDVTQKTYSIGSDISWEVDIFGKLSNAKKIAAASWEEQRAYAQAVQTQLIATIAEDYYQLLVYDGQISITQQNIVSWNEYIRVQKALMNAGEADGADVSQAEASKLSEEVTLQTIKQQKIELENALSVLIGRRASTISRSTLDSQQLPQDFTTGVSVVTLANRPDVRQYEALLKQAYYATGKARSAFYPSLTLTGSAGWTNSGINAITNPGTLLLQAAGSLLQPIFNNGQSTANLKIANDQQQEALINWKQSLLDAGKEVNNALIKGQTARKSIQLEEQQVDKLNKTLHDTEAKMKYGSTNYLQVIIARQSLLSAQLDLLSNHYNELESIVTLYEALGGGCN